MLKVINFIYLNFYSFFLFLYIRMYIKREIKGLILKLCFPLLCCFTVHWSFCIILSRYTFHMMYTGLRTWSRVSFQRFLSPIICVYQWAILGEGYRVANFAKSQTHVIQIRCDFREVKSFSFNPVYLYESDFIRIARSNLRRDL